MSKFTIITNITFMLILISCASGGKNRSAKVDLDEVSNADFKKDQAVPYKAGEDYFKKVDSRYSDALNDETIQRVDKFGGDVELKDIVSRIIRLCYDKEFEDAEELIKKNQEAYRSNPAFWNQVGTCYSLQKERRKALLFYNKSLEFDTNYAPALNNLGVLYRNLGEDQKAEVAFKRAIKGNNFAKTPRFNLAHLYLKYGLYNFALKELSVLERVSKNDVDVLTGLGTAYLMSGDSKRALGYFKRIDEGFYEYPYIGINAAFAHYLEGDKERAKDILDDVDKDQLKDLKEYYQSVKERIL
tara:strand:+ start:55498 stop:56397 length:900 start_codon:yes stop_codon:yes gene_type:complete